MSNDFNILDREQRLVRRSALADVRNAWLTCAQALEELMHAWSQGDWPPDLVGDDSWPFNKSLEDQAAELRAAAHRLLDAIDFLELEPETITLPRVEFDLLLQELDTAAVRPTAVPKLLALVEKYGQQR